MGYKNFSLTAKYKGKIWKVTKLDWVCSSACTNKKPSWVSIERDVLDDNGEYVRTDEEGVLADKVELTLKFEEEL